MFQCAGIEGMFEMGRKIEDRIEREGHKKLIIILNVHPEPKQDVRNRKRYS